jgi:hypothetical protein
VTMTTHRIKITLLTENDSASGGLGALGPECSLNREPPAPPRILHDPLKSVPPLLLAESESY